MKKIVVIFSLILFTILITCVYSFAKEDERSFPLTKNNQPVAYFTVWRDNASLTKNPTLKTISEKISNYGYVSKTIFGEKIAEANSQIKKNDLNIIAWKEFVLPSEKIKKQSYLWLLESPISIKLSEIPEYRKHFNKIFTWHKPSADGKQVIYVPIPWPDKTDIRILRDYDISSKEYLVSVISQYKDYGEYQKRGESVLWFLENHPEDIRFFGKGWKKIYSKLSEKAKIQFDKKYGGYIQDKIGEIAKAKFVFAYENIRFEDYVSEKIYDVMAAGSVPIYSGAPNITDYVPKNCFIDLNVFENYEELYDFLTTMTDAEYNTYLSCIEKFLKDPKKLENYTENVAEKILRHIDI